MSGLPIRVVKVGGSLFGFTEFVQAWNGWLAEQPPAVNVLIAGGGKLADVIREADAAWGLGEEAAHWLCVDVMGVSARLLATLLPKSAGKRRGMVCCDCWPSATAASRSFSLRPVSAASRSELAPSAFAAQLERDQRLDRGADRSRACPQANSCCSNRAIRRMTRRTGRRMWMTISPRRS